MKTIFTTIVLLTSALSSFAKYDDSKLSVYFSGKQNFMVLVDNQRYQSKNNSVLINDLTPGHHNIKVYRTENGQKSGKGRGIFGNNGSVLVYSTSLYVKPRHFIDIMINRFGKALVDERSITRNDGRDWDDDGDYYNDDRDDDRWGDRDNSYMQRINDNAFASLREALRRENFENSRFQKAVNAVNSHQFLSTQVKQLMQLFSFERNKLELAKLAYKNTVDKQNYFVVYDEFAYSRSKEQLTEYIRQYK